MLIKKQIQQGVTLIEAMIALVVIRLVYSELRRCRLPR